MCCLVNGICLQTVAIYAIHTFISSRVFMYYCPILVPAQDPVREDISELKEDIKHVQEMMVCIFVCVLTK